MRALVLVACLALGGCAHPGRSVVVAKVEPIPPSNKMNPQPSWDGPVCLFLGSPNLPHVVVGRVAATKKGYGAPEQLIPEAAKALRMYGANAAFNWSAGQRFKGANPYRAVAPTGVGIAVRVSEPFSCTELGGQEAPSP